MEMTRSRVAAIAAGAYNVCGPRSGESANPTTLYRFDLAVVRECLSRYGSEADDLYTRAEAQAALDVLNGVAPFAPQEFPGNERLWDGV